MPKPKTYNPKPNFGFTLLELLVSIAIIGLLSTAVAANLRGGSRPQAVALEAERFINVIRQISARAASGIDVKSSQPLGSKERYSVLIKGNMYKVFVDSDATGALGVFDGDETALSIYAMPAGISVASRAPTDPNVIGFKTGSGDMLFGSSCAYGNQQQPSPKLLIDFIGGGVIKTVELQCLVGTVTIK